MSSSRKTRFSLLLSTVSLLAAAAVLLRTREHWKPLPTSMHSARSEQTSLPAAPRAFAARMPARIVWAWEEPEDLRSLPATVGVAYLAETLLLGERLRVVPRRQPLQVAPGTPTMAVVRMEAVGGFAGSPELQEAAERQLAEVARRPGTRALQIDFDAGVSELPFYRTVLQALRRAMPSDEPLSITALASWCAERSWLRTLPIDEAVPMLFRMGGPREMATVTRGRFPLRAPVCRGSRGLSVDEPWPAVLGTMDTETRLYLFAPGPWQPSQLRAVAAAPLAALSESLEDASHPSRGDLPRQEAEP